MTISQSMGASKTPSTSCEDVDVEQALCEQTPLLGSHIESLVSDVNYLKSSHDVILHDDYSANDHGSFKSSSMLTSDGDDDGDLDDFVGSGLSKRAPNTNELFEPASKRAKTGGSQNLSLYDKFPHVEVPEKYCVLGEDDENVDHLQEEFSPVLEDDHSSDSSVLSEGLSYLDYFPHKEVAVGLDFQADIPVWNPHGYKNTRDQSGEKLMGENIIPMPEAGADTSNDAYSVICRDCWNCGSVECVKKHVAEAREKIMKSLGPRIFSELGFLEMGEYVALKWTEEEEHVFHQVVLSNPKSMGKNFWKVLPRVFPNRSSKDFVSYYYNVFMLGKRSRQNRSAPLDVDSDNEEWQDGTIDDYYEDSEDESPVYDDAIEDKEENVHEVIDEEDASENHVLATNNNANGSGIMSPSFTCCNSYPPTSNTKQNSPQIIGSDFQDDSCTSFEIERYSGGIGPLSDNPVGADGHAELLAFHEDCTNDSLGCFPDSEYDGFHCDLRSWDLDYFSRSEKLVDFLPTCSVLEVFREETSGNETRGGSP